ncbi:probable transcriptional regulatory protein Cagg_2594 [Eupeodes corollae]|uniref:probable transcriptional regulatory protein Cagg_2594 n=1 Tax=Eupeodes corollae TaxID=290404 RepID=UPI002490AAE7|nr:probable transcriptional regulatory protein Cagg_2594 [Eupeodes corollae]
MWASKLGFLWNNKLSCKIITTNCKSNLFTSSKCNAGHSKWANIRHIKALKDGQKSALFTKYARQIRLAIQDGGSSDPALNVQLRNVMDDALRKNMPMATIQNCIKKTTASKTLLKKYFLCWRFRHKVFAICALYTDNFPQLKMDLAAVLRKSGTVYIEGQHMFDEVGIIEAIANQDSISKSKSLEEFEQICTEDAIECGVEEVEVLDETKGTVNFFCDPVQLTTISQVLKERGYLVENAEHLFVPKTTVELSEDEFNAYQNFLTKVREFSGVEEIYDNVKV